MKNLKLFKYLIEIVIIVSASSLVLSILIFLNQQLKPEFLSILDRYTMHDVSSAETVTDWPGTIAFYVASFVFLSGLYFLRKTALSLVQKERFSEQLTINLKKAGIRFLIAGLLPSLHLSYWFIKMTLFGGVFAADMTFYFFTMAVGLFLIIQSYSLTEARVYKEEVDLTF